MSSSHHSAIPAPRSSTPSGTPILTPSRSLVHPPARRASASLYPRSDSHPLPSRLSSSSPASPLAPCSSGPAPPVASVDADAHSLSASPSSPTSVQVLLRIRPARYDANVPSRFRRSVVAPISPCCVSVEALPPSVPGPSAPAPSSSAASSQPSHHRLIQRFTFDRVIAPDEGQQAVWSSVQGLLARFFEGYNVTVFAYGQTSSGKSYTMGTDRLSPDQLDTLSFHDHSDRLGIIPRAVQHIFQRIHHTPSKPSQSTVTASYVEIYNEDLIDLIASSQSPPGSLPQVTIREDKDGHIIWSGLKEVKVSKASEAMCLLDQGSSVRQTNSTEMNTQSSRSHAIFSINLTQRKLLGSTHSNPGISPQSSSRRPNSWRVTSPTPYAKEPDDGEWVHVTSKFHFVDLAGSERLKRTAAAGERIKEGISINSGLHALGNVISALADPSKAKATTHVPYRDSKLTRLLQDSLGGNSYTLMIACVSPSEYNLSETLNTIKYANRARNIKNQAQVNAVEAGWDDIEHLQSTVLKLRRELAHLRGSTSVHEIANSQRTLSSIDENATFREEHSAQYLELQGRFSELQAKYVKVLSDLAQAQNNNLQLATGDQAQKGNLALSSSAFEEMIQPIVEEYEKCITAMESQLALTKAALAISEQSMAQQEEKLAQELLINENQAMLMADLKDRLGRLAERESNNESYIKVLELKLSATTESEDASGDLINELRQELARMKEHGVKSEAYIKDLEKRLSYHEGGSSGLTDRIRVLEEELALREGTCDELEARLNDLRSQLPASDRGLLDHQKDLLAQLSEKEDKVSALELTLQEYQEAKTHIESARSRLEQESRQAAEKNAQLLKRVQELEAQPKSSAPSGGLPDPHLGPHSSTMPVNLNTRSEEVAGSGQGAFSEELRQLQRRYDSTVAELEQVRVKYQSSLKELEDLSCQLDESRLLQQSMWSRRSGTLPGTHLRYSQSNVGSRSASPVPPSPCQSHLTFSLANGTSALPAKGFGSPLPPHPSVAMVAVEDPDGPLETLDTDLDSERVSPTNSPGLLRHSRNGRSRGSGQLKLAGGGPLGHPFPFRAGSASASAIGMPFSHQSYPPHTRSLSLSLCHDQSGVVRAELSASLLQSAVRSPRSISPGLSRVLTANSEHFSAQSPGRSYESLEKEVIQLQEVLKEREEEIRALETSIREIRRQSGVATGLSLIERSSESLSCDPSCPKDPPASEGGVMDGQTTRLGGDLAPLDASESPVGSIPTPGVRDSQDSGESAPLLNTMTAENSKSILRMDDLMRSMAQKESAHLEEIDELKNQLTSTRKQHDELVKLSRDQVVNISAEIEALRDRLGKAETHESQMANQLARMQDLLATKEYELDQAQHAAQSMILKAESLWIESKEAEIGELKQQHLEALQHLKSEQKENLKLLVASSEEKLAAKEAELERLQLEWQDTLQSQLKRHTEATRAEFENKLNEAAMAQTHTRQEALREQQNHFDEAFHQLVQENAVAAEKLAVELRQSKVLAAQESETRIAQLQERHMNELAELTSCLSGPRDVGSNGAKEGQAAAHHSTQLKKLKAFHHDQLEAQRKDMEGKMDALQLNHTHLLAKMNEEHEAQLEELKAEHEEVLVASLTELDARRTKKFEASMSAMHDQHLKQLEELKLERMKEVEQLARQFEAKVSLLTQGTLGATPQAKAGSGDEPMLRRHYGEEVALTSAEYEERIAVLRAGYESEVRDLEAKLAASLDPSSGLEKEKKMSQQKTSELMKTEIAGLETTTQRERLNGQPAQRDMIQSEAEAELQGALDALSTLNKAWLESQTERDRLLKQMGEMKKQWVDGHEGTAKELASLQAELSQVRLERDELLQERARPGEQESLGRLMGDHRIGGQSMRSDSPSLPGIQHKNQLLNTVKPPPPTPPPSIPPPPLPTSQPGLPSTGANGTGLDTRMSNASSQLSHMHSTSGRESPSTSVGTNSGADSVQMDPRVVKKVEEQEMAIAKLSKQLTSCEAELKANIDLVANLESALNDTERNLRKSRLQMNELAKDRDKLGNLSETLRNQLNAANAEVESVRNNVLAEKVQFENQLGEERRAKENAKKQLESRMEEMQASRMTRRNKFNCF